MKAGGKKRQDPRIREVTTTGIKDVEKVRGRREGDP